MRRSLRVLLALPVVISACSGNDDDAPAPDRIGRDGSTVVDGADDVEIGAPLDAYAITYRVEELAGDEVQTTTATLIVQRPFRSRLEIRDGETVVQRRVADFAYLAEQPGDGDPTVFAAVPAPAPNDVRADLAVDDAGGEVRRVAGRECQVHALGAPLMDGDVVEGDTTESCIDADGLLLEEVVTDGDLITARWVATDVDTSPTIVDDDFFFGGVEPLPAAAGGGSVQEVMPTSQSLGTFFELDDPPAGFTHRGRYAVVPPQLANPDDPETRAQVIAAVVDVFERGRDVVVIDQGGTLGQVPPFGADPNGVLVDDIGEVGALGESIRTAAGGEIRVLRPPGRYVRVAGTLPVADLVAIARSLRAVEGTGLVYP